MARFISTNGGWLQQESGSEARRLVAAIHGVVGLVATHMNWLLCRFASPSSDRGTYKPAASCPSTLTTDPQEPTPNQLKPILKNMADRYHAKSSSDAMSAEAEYAAHNYHPLPVVFARAQGASVWDPVSPWVSLCGRPDRLLRLRPRKKTTTSTSCLHTAP
jgi:hypothetical protein